MESDRRRGGGGPRRRGDASTSPTCAAAPAPRAGGRSWSAPSRPPPTSTASSPTWAPSPACSTRQGALAFVDYAAGGPLRAHRHAPRRPGGAARRDLRLDPQVPGRAARARACWWPTATSSAPARPSAPAAGPSTTSPAADRDQVDYVHAARRARGGRHPRHPRRHPGRRRLPAEGPRRGRPRILRARRGAGPRGGGAAAPPPAHPRLRAARRAAPAHPLLQRRGAAPRPRLGAARPPLRHPEPRRLLLRRPLRPPAARASPGSARSATAGSSPRGDLGAKPGWVRVSLPWYAAPEDVEFMLRAVEFVATAARPSCPSTGSAGATGSGAPGGRGGRSVAAPAHRGGNPGRDRPGRRSVPSPPSARRSGPAYLAEATRMADGLDGALEARAAHVEPSHRAARRRRAGLVPLRGDGGDAGIGTLLP